MIAKVMKIIILWICVVVGDKYFSRGQKMKVLSFLVDDVIIVVVTPKGSYYQVIDAKDGHKAFAKIFDEMI